jgi:hypothetical protein
MTKPKYKKGNQVKMVTYLSYLYETGKPIYFNHKFLSAGFYQNWSLRQLTISVKSGRVWEAIPIDPKTK